MHNHDDFKLNGRVHWTIKAVIFELLSYLHHDAFIFLRHIYNLGWLEVVRTHCKDKGIP